MSPWPLGTHECQFSTNCSCESPQIVDSANLKTEKQRQKKDLPSSYCFSNFKQQIERQRQIPEMIAQRSRFEVQSSVRQLSIKTSCEPGAPLHK